MWKTALIVIQKHFRSLQARPFNYVVSKKELRCIIQCFVYTHTAVVKPYVIVVVIVSDALFYHSCA